VHRQRRDGDTLVDMRHAIVGFTVAACCFAAAFAACVSDSSGPVITGDGGAQGGIDEPCYANGSCNGGLACISSVCVALDAGPVATDAGPSITDASDADARSSADADILDAEAGCGPCSPTAMNCNAYPSAAATCTYDPTATAFDTNGSGYCLGPNACFVDGGCTGNKFYCRTKDDCAGQDCCTETSPASCGGTLDVFHGVFTQCATGCTGAGVTVCASATDCNTAAPNCVPMTATNGSASQTVGVCSP
jgi:hypothetical protein